MKWQSPPYPLRAVAYLLALAFLNSPSLGAKPATAQKYAYSVGSTTEPGRSQTPRQHGAKKQTAKKSRSSKGHDVRKTRGVSQKKASQAKRRAAKPGPPRVAVTSPSKPRGPEVQAYRPVTQLAPTPPTAQKPPSGPTPVSPAQPQQTIKLAALGNKGAITTYPGPAPAESSQSATPHVSRKLAYELAQRTAQGTDKSAEDARRLAGRSGSRDQGGTTSAASFEQLLRSALTTHPSIVSRQATLQAANAAVEGANWQRFPTPVIEAGAATSQGGFGTFRVQQPIWTGGRIAAGVEGAEAQRNAARTGIDEAGHDVAHRLITAFSDAQRHQSRQEIARNGVREHEKLVQLIERRVEQQVNPAVDLTFAKARLLQANHELSLANQALANALNQLSQLSGQPVTRIVPTTPGAKELPGDRAIALELATKHSPLLTRLGHDEEAAGADILSKKSNYLPQVSVRYEKVANPIANTGSSDRVMLVLEAQPGAGLSAGAGVDSAVAKREAIRRNRDAALLDLHEKVGNDWNDYQASRQRLDSASQGRLIAKDVFDSYGRQFSTGKKSWIDVMNAAREATQAEMLVADAEGQLVASLLRLKLATGNFFPGNQN